VKTSSADRLLTVGKETGYRVATHSNKTDDTRNMAYNCGAGRQGAARAILIFKGSSISGLNYKNCRLLCIY